MMCIYSATNSSHYTEEDNVNADSSQIITSVGLPQTPPDSDPGSSPSGLSNEDNDSKECLVEALEKQLDVGATEGIKLVNDAQDEGYTPNNDNGNNLVPESEVVEENSAKPNLIKTHDEQTNTAKTYQLHWLGTETNESANHDCSPLQKSNLSEVKSNQVNQKSKVVSVELPPTPPTMVDEIHNQKKRRKSSKLSKRKLRLSEDKKREGINIPSKDRDCYEKIDSAKDIRFCTDNSDDNDEATENNESNKVADDIDKDVHSDMSSEEEEQEIEKVLDVNPINRYKRVLVKNGEGGWLLQFVSPCGQYRFNSEKELALNLGQNIDDEEDEPHVKAKKSPTDPFAQKLTILRKRLANGLSHFLRQSLDECAIRAQRNHIQTCSHNNKHESYPSDLDETNISSDETSIKESQEKKETKIAPFTFVNMRQNIFDMTASKRKRIQASCGKQTKYRKHHSTKDWNRRNSIAAINISTNKTNSNEDCLVEDMNSSMHSFSNGTELETNKIENEEPLVQLASAQINYTKDQNHKVCESIITSIIYSCVDQQSSVENRLHSSSQIVETNVTNEKDSQFSKCNSNNQLDKNSTSSNAFHQDRIPQNSSLDTCNRRSLTSSNCISIVQHQDSQTQKVDSHQIQQSLTSRSPMIGCDNVDNETLIDCHNNVNNKHGDVPNDFCDKKAIFLEEDEDSGIEVGPISSHDQGDLLMLTGSKIQKGEKKLLMNDVDNPNLSFDLSVEGFLRPSKRISPTVKRSMSLETQLSEIDSEVLKDRKGLKKPSSKRKARKSCDETVSYKVPKVSDEVNPSAEKSTPLMQSIFEISQGTETYSKETVDENDHGIRPAHRLPWPRSKKLSHTNNQTDDIPGSNISDKKTADKKDLPKSYSESDHLLSLRDRGSEVESHVLNENVEDEIMNGHLISAMPTESDAEKLSSHNELPTEYLVKDNFGHHNLQQKEIKNHERCGEILPALSETEEVIMLGGEKDENNHSSYSLLHQPSCKGDTEKTLNNIDDVIEFVVNDISGTKTGIDLQNKLMKANATQTSKTSRGQYKMIQDLLSSHRAFSKPAPACKKRLIRSNLSIGYLNSNPEAKEFPFQSDLIHESINDTISRTTECSVAIVDLFHLSPLSRLICTGCFRKFSSKRTHPDHGKIPQYISDDIHVNLIQGTITMVCANCGWWTMRSVKGKLMKMKS